MKRINVKSPRLRYLIVLIFMSTITFGQKTKDNYPYYGDYTGNTTLRFMKNYSIPEVALNALQGKPVILDFFSSGCSTCFASFPHVNELKKKFDGRVNLFLVGL